MSATGISTVHDARPPPATAVNQLISYGTIQTAVTIPGLPAPFPDGLDKMKTGSPLGPLAPDASLPPQYQMEPSDCPIITCKTRQWLNMSCNGWKNSSVLAVIGAGAGRMRAWVQATLDWWIWHLLYWGPACIPPSQPSWHTCATTSLAP